MECLLIQKKTICQSIEIAGELRLSNAVSVNKANIMPQDHNHDDGCNHGYESSTLP